MLAYILLMFISPYINEYLSIIEKDNKKYRTLMAVLFFILCIYGFVFNQQLVLGVNNGYSLIYAIFLYIVGNYIRKQNKFHMLRWYKPLIIYIIMALINFILIICLLYISKNNLAWKMFSYNNPIILIESVSLFVLFINLKYTGKFYNTVASFGKKYFSCIPNTFNAITSTI